MDNKIHDLLREGTLQSQMELISLLINRSENKQSNISYYRIFRQYLIDFKISVATPFMMVGPKRGLSCFVSEFLSLYVTVRDYEEQAALLKDLLQDLADLSHSKRPMLKMTVAQNLLQVLQQLEASRFLARNHNGIPLRFYFVPYGNTSMNAGYFPHLNLVVIYKCDINNGEHPEYVFMHELGHVFQLYTTRNLTAVPDSFKKVTRGMFKSCPEEVLVEVFADCFSVAVMKGTPFEEKNPFCTLFLQEHQILLKEYFSSLFVTKRK
ncbi:hypothetical protein ACFQZE_08355 [Paenibacillus sp. GCM10027627]|uniref:hypothetical protein n=1 Tax=unclassified Paenibacillus TaxID=185978 RepID=UPI0036347105